MITYTRLQHPDQHQLDEVADFLLEHLGEYGDRREDIMKCLNYASSDDPARGGSIMIARDDEKGQLVGAVVINDTGMEGYIPEHILVYIATHGAYRGHGIGSELMSRIIEILPGGIALHVEPHNPAKRLYERLGFTNKYLEMRRVKQ